MKKNAKKSIIFILFSFILFFSIQGLLEAYGPPHCKDVNIKDDFSKSEVAIVGRVIEVKRVKVPDDELTAFRMEAVVKVGKVISGKVKKDDEIKIVLGYVFQKGEEKNDIPLNIQLYNSHPPYQLSMNDVYLLCLNMSKENKGFWEPRSCHHSIHEVVWETVRDEKTTKQILSVKESVGPNSYSEPVEYEKFIEEKTK